MGRVRKSYPQPTVRKRIEALFLGNLGRIVTREMILAAARDPKTGRAPENWHQRLSELRTDQGYSILTSRDRAFLKVSEYLLESDVREPRARSRVQISAAAWATVLARSGRKCEWVDGQSICGLAEGAIDPVGGGRVVLTPDHKAPHSIAGGIDPGDASAWQALCGRHQVVKKNFWDDRSGKLNYYAIVQAAPHEEKERIFAMLREYFGR